ncbi:dihydrolipoamide acetyltransferase family protein [Rhodanobacter ginsengisoli]|uniref:Dihydrolipoamide acetyltransferase component of pyruvate dehydrogenase complex n=2 Tax=Rhodanobacter ginsengisoli TaxID=418646 RepID=A0ABW0QM19_9GAMM
MSEFRMPSLGADMDAATLVEWLRQPGDPVRRGDVIAAVETQKGVIEIETYEDGVLDELYAQVGQRVPVGAVLARIRSDGQGPSAAPSKPLPSAAGTAAPARRSPPASVPAPTPAAEPPQPATPRITPAARKRAQQLGLDVATVTPGPEGVVGLREVEAVQVTSATPSRAAAPGRKPGLDLDQMRQAIAAAMARSWREIPHYFVSSTLDLTPLLTWLEQENARRPIAGRVHYAASLIKACALALKAVPALNGHYGEHGFEPASRVNLGVAVALRGGGLIAPAILDADTLTLTEVMERLDDLVARVRGGRLRSSEMTAATATLSNLGDDTADALQPVIYPPQVAIIGCGRIAERAWAHQGTVSACRTMTVAVGGDHRVSDGRSAAKFLNHLDGLLQQPEQL